MQERRTRQLDVASHFHRFSFYSGHPLLSRSVHHTETITASYLKAFSVWSDCARCLKSLRHFPCILSLDQEIHSLRETGHWALADVLIGNGVADAVTMLCKTQRALFREMEFSFTVSNRQSNFYTSWLRS